MASKFLNEEIETLPPRAQRDLQEQRLRSLMQRDQQDRRNVSAGRHGRPRSPAYVHCFDGRRYAGLYAILRNVPAGVRAFKDGRCDGLEIDGDGTEGEMVFTHLGRRCAPLLRFRSNDRVVVKSSPCPCGRTGMRLRILGRTDDMLIVRGVNVWPSAIKDVVTSMRPHTTGEMRVLPACLSRSIASTSGLRFRNTRAFGERRGLRR